MNINVVVMERKIRNHLKVDKQLEFGVLGLDPNGDFERTHQTTVNRCRCYEFSNFMTKIYFLKPNLMFANELISMKSALYIYGCK